MNKDIIVIKVTIILFCFRLVNTDNYENYDDDPAAYYERSTSVDSESNEVYNVTMKQKPIRGRETELKREYIDDNVTIDISPNLYATSKEVNASKSIDHQNCKQTHVSDYPYSVSIQKKSAHYASGALIHKKWILTVAEEFYNIRETIKLFRARLGSVNCKKNGALVPLKRIEIHPSYVYKQPGYDLAMLRIGQHLQCSNYIRPISLSAVKGLTFSVKYLSTYWSRLMVGGKILPQTAKERTKPHSMRVSTQKLIPWGKCYDVMLMYNITLDFSSLCLEPIKSHHSPCMPDVGAPVIADDGLWGITSGWISDDCLTYPSPTIFTRISLEPTTSWLDTILDEDTK